MMVVLAKGSCLELTKEERNVIGIRSDFRGFAVLAYNNTTKS